MVKNKKQKTKKSRSRSRSKERRQQKAKKETKTLKGIQEENSEEEEFSFRTFKKLSAEVIKELNKIPGLTETQRLVDESGITGVIMQPDNYEAFLTATKVLNQDPLIQITPSLLLDPALRNHQFDTHQFYSTQTPNFLKSNLAVPIPIVFRPKNQVNLMLQFRSALVASFYEIKRFQDNDNPQTFNYIPKGTELGEMMIIYGGGRHQLAIGPLKYYR